MYEILPKCHMHPMAPNEIVELYPTISFNFYAQKRTKEFAYVTTLTLQPFCCSGFVGTHLTEQTRK